MLKKSKDVCIILCLLLAVFLCVMPTTSAATEINSCQAISASGEYLLNTTISNSSEMDFCINISSNNVTLDCDGNTLNTNNSDVGIYVSDVNNLTILNCNISTNAEGLRIEHSNNMTIRNSIFSTSFTSIYLDDVENSTFANLTLQTNDVCCSGALQLGIYADEVDNSDFLHTKIFNVKNGLNMWWSSGSRFENLSIINITEDGLKMRFSDMINVTNVTFNAIQQNSFSLGYVENSTFENIYDFNNLENSIFLYGTTTNLDFKNLTIDTGSTAFKSLSSGINSFEDIFILNTKKFSFSALNSSKVLMSDLELKNVLLNNTIRLDSIVDSDLRVYPINEEFNVNFSMYYFNESNCDDYKYSVVSYPSHSLTTTNYSNILNVNFTPTVEGIYTIKINVTLEDGTISTRSYKFLFGDAKYSSARYYIDDVLPTYTRQYSSTEHYRGSLLNSIPTELATISNPVTTVARSSQFSPDELLHPFYILKNVSAKLYYTVSNESGSIFIDAPLFALRQYEGDSTNAFSTEIEPYDTLSSGTYSLRNVNITNDYFWRSYFLNFLVYGFAPSVYSSVETLSYLDFGYLYQGVNMISLSTNEDVKNTDIQIYSSYDVSNSTTEKYILEFEGEGNYTASFNLTENKIYDIYYDDVLCDNNNVDSSASGVHNITYQLDGYNNLTIETNLVSPTLFINNPVVGEDENANPVLHSITASENVTRCVATIDDNSYDMNSNDNLTYTLLKDAAAGTHTVEFECWDFYNNSGVNSTTFYYYSSSGGGGGGGGGGFYEVVENDTTLKSLILKTPSIFYYGITNTFNVEVYDDNDDLIDAELIIGLENNRSYKIEKWRKSKGLYEIDFYTSDVINELNDTLQFTITATLNNSNIMRTFNMNITQPDIQDKIKQKTLNFFEEISVFLEKNFYLVLGIVLLIIMIILITTLNRGLF